MTYLYIQPPIQQTSIIRKYYNRHIKHGLHEAFFSIFFFSTLEMLTTSSPGVPQSDSLSLLNLGMFTTSSPGVPPSDSLSPPQLTPPRMSCSYSTAPPLASGSRNLAL